MTGVVGEFERTADRFPIHIRISMISAGDRAGASVAHAGASMSKRLTPDDKRRETSQAEGEAAAGGGDEHLVTICAVASWTKLSPLQCIGISTSGSSALISPTTCVR